MNKYQYGYYPQQPTLPFMDVLPEQSKVAVELKKTKKSKASIEAILEHKDDTLLFMTLAVTMTSKNEMPIVKAYIGPIPSDIRGLHRLAPRRLYHIAPHFYFEDSRIFQYWNKPFETEGILSNFTVSIGIDFSMTNEMTRSQKMYASFLNKLWCAWLQSRGHKVIPNISFPDEWRQDYWIEGWPKHSVIAISNFLMAIQGNGSKLLNAFARNFSRFISSAMAQRFLERMRRIVLISIMTIIVLQMGGNNSYKKELGGVPDYLRTHDELPNRIGGHKILLQKGNDSRVKIPMNSNSESPIYLGAHRKEDGTIEITTFGLYENHKCVGQIDLKFDKQGNFIPYANNGEGSSHSHLFSENPTNGIVGRKSGQKSNHHPIDSKYDTLIQKIIEYNKAKHK